MKEKISLNEINSPTIKKNIAVCEENILKFAEIIRGHIMIFGAQNVFGVKELFQAQKRDPVLRKESMLSSIYSTYYTKNVGDIPTHVCEYEAVWTFDLTGNMIPQNDNTAMEESFEHVIRFKFCQNEFYASKDSTAYKENDSYRNEVDKDPIFFISNGESHYVAEKAQTLSIDIAGLIKPYSYDDFDNHCKTIAVSNEGDDIKSILNARVATTAIIKINFILDELTLYEHVNKELKDC